MKKSLNMIMQWLVENEAQSLSLRAMIDKLYQEELTNQLDKFLLYDSAPFEAEDFIACEDVLSIMSWEGRIDELANISQSWSAVVKHWPRLHQFYIDQDTVGLGDYLRILRRNLRNRRKYREDRNKCLLEEAH